MIEVSDDKESSDEGRDRSEQDKSSDDDEKESGNEGREGFEARRSHRHLGVGLPQGRSLQQRLQRCLLARSPVTSDLHEQRRP